MSNEPQSVDVPSDEELARVVNRQINEDAGADSTNIARAVREAVENAYKARVAELEDALAKTRAKSGRRKKAIRDLQHSMVWRDRETLQRRVVHVETQMTNLAENYQHVLRERNEYRERANNAEHAREQSRPCRVEFDVTPERLFEAWSESDVVQSWYFFALRYLTSHARVCVPENVPTAEELSAYKFRDGSGLMPRQWEWVLRWLAPWLQPSKTEPPADPETPKTLTREDVDEFLDSMHRRNVPLMDAGNEFYRWLTAHLPCKVGDFPAYWDGGGSEPDAPADPVTLERLAEIGYKAFFKSLEGHDGAWEQRTEAGERAHKAVAAAILAAAKPEVDATEKEVASEALGGMYEKPVYEQGNTEWMRVGRRTLKFCNSRIRYRVADMPKILTQEDVDAKIAELQRNSMLVAVDDEFYRWLTAHLPFKVADFPAYWDGGGSESDADSAASIGLDHTGEPLTPNSTNAADFGVRNAPWTPPHGEVDDCDIPKPVASPATRTCATPKAAPPSATSPSRIPDTTRTPRASARGEKRLHQGTGFSPNE